MATLESRRSQERPACTSELTRTAFADSTARPVVANSLAIFEEFRVDQRERRPLLGQVVFEEDGLNWADFGTNAAVDALVRVDEVLIGVVRRMDAVDRADLDAAIVLDANAWLGDHIRHGTSLLTRFFRVVRVGALRTRCGPHMRSSSTNSRALRV